MTTHTPTKYIQRENDHLVVVEVGSLSLSLRWESRSGSLINCRSFCTLITSRVAGRGGVRKFPGYHLEMNSMRVSWFPVPVSVCCYTLLLFSEERAVCRSGWF